MIPEGPDLNRRNWMTRVLYALGGSGVAAQLFGQEHSHPAASGELAENAQPWRPAFLTMQQNDALASLGECIVPGSAAARCNRVIDLILTLESQETKRELVQALADFDSQATKQYGRSFRELDAGQKHAVLSAASGDGAELGPQFRLVKEWVADAYWSSQQGLRELGWTGQMAWSSFDGCSHPGTHS